MIILASSSPRRKELLKLITNNFDSIDTSLDESTFYSVYNSQLSSLLAKMKAYSVFNKYKNDTIISCDTVVIYKDKILGKAKNREEAKAMLELLSDKTHVVLTSYTILNDIYEINKTVKSYVTFNKLNSDVIKTYLDSNLYIGKAGSYGIQDKGYNLIKFYKGSYYNIMGLPIEQIEKDLKKLKLI